MEDDLKKVPGSRGLSTLEKCLILLFLALTGVCVGLAVLHFTGESDRPTNEGHEITSGCGGPRELKAPSGEFTSVNYPSSYANCWSCSWRITVDPGKVIHLWFEDFSLEPTDQCTADFLTLQDNLGVIGRLCGRLKPRSIVSLGNSMLVFFNTNDLNTEKGFKARYQAVEPERVPEIAGAGGFLQGDQGDLLTPGFPEKNYENGALYQWRITVPEGEKIRLTFTSFDLVPEACKDCVHVYDGHKTGSALLGRFCGGKNPGRVQSSGRTMVVRFKTDATLTSKGFNATYTKTSMLSTTIKPTVRATTTIKPTVRATTTIKPTVRATTTINPTVRATTTIKPTVRATTTIKPTVRATTTIKPTVRATTTINPTVRATTTIKPTVRATTTIKPTVRATTTINPTVRATTTLPTTTPTRGHEATEHPVGPTKP
ncbi:hypothetical protein DPEC_G00183190 [Dallia pectoralis]|uniref:Uncharacterized protein n=1 Tax=Dallia pectoralis TaxID=75939 RepID=A0ACC2GB03_DALPE|nr:hypothetical protein DPEC_G00183190 [Dallia pectoralis]